MAAVFFILLQSQTGQYGVVLFIVAIIGVFWFVIVDFSVFVFPHFDLQCLIKRPPDERGRGRIQYLEILIPMI